MTQILIAADSGFGPLPRAVSRIVSAAVGGPELTVTVPKQVVVWILYYITGHLYSPAGPSGLDVKVLYSLGAVKGVKYINPYAKAAQRFQMMKNRLPQARSNHDGM